MKHYIRESNFFNYKGDKGVAISRTVPAWWNGKRYPALAPTWKILALWREGKLEEEDYIYMFHRDVLSKLDYNKVIEEIGNDAVLLCWERTGFCHRHLVVEWLNKEIK